MDRCWQSLFARRRFGMRPGLEGIHALLEALGHPELACPVVHVAGTNGKGSVCALTASMLSAAGLRTGLFTSPHLVRFNERYRLDGEEIGDAGLEELTRRVEEAAAPAERAAHREITFFECSAAIAFEHFRRAGAQAAVIETGLGGRCDATNVVACPAATAITRISIEHAEQLGPDVASIAAEKAGIIKAGVPVVAGRTDAGALSVIRRVARERGAPLLDVGDIAVVSSDGGDGTGQRVAVETAAGSYGRFRLPLAGAHQAENLATAVVLAEAACERLGVELTPLAVRKGCAGVRWEGRLTQMAGEPPVWLDGAHNPGAAEALAPAARKLAGGRPLGLVLGMCADKDAAGFLHPFAGICSRVWLVPVPSERAMDAASLRAAARQAGIEAEECPAVADGVAAAKRWAAERGGVVVVTGSLFLVGAVLAANRGEPYEQGGGDYCPRPVCP